MSGNSAGTFLILAVLALPILLIVFQRRAMRRQAAQVQESLGLGVEVMTHSGVFGIVRALRDDFVVIEIAPGVQTRWARAAIGRVVPTDDAGGADASADAGDAASAQTSDASEPGSPEQP